MTTIELKTSDLINIYRKVAPFMSIEGTRPCLNGVCLDGRDGVLTAVATDGHRLAKLELPDAKVIIEPPEFSFILPSDLVQQLSTVKRNITTPDKPAVIEIDGTKVTITFENPIPKTEGFTTQVLTGQLVDGTYPDWRRVIPELVEATVGFNPAYLMAVAKAAMDSKTGRVALHIKDDTSPMLVKEVDNPNVEYVVMPVRI